MYGIFRRLQRKLIEGSRVQDHGRRCLLTGNSLCVTINPASSFAIGDYWDLAGHQSSKHSTAFGFENHATLPRIVDLGGMGCFELCLTIPCFDRQALNVQYSNVLALDRGPYVIRSFSHMQFPLVFIIRLLSPLRV